MRRIRIEVVFSDGPLAGIPGLTVELPAVGEPWPEAKWRHSLVYRFKTMTNDLPSLPVYALVADDKS
jgi:hypothetical protein